MMPIFSRTCMLVLFFVCANPPVFAQQAVLSSPQKIENNESAIPADEADSLKNLVYIGNINIQGYKRTKEYIIEREIPFKQGDHLLKSNLEKKLELCRQQLMNTTLFVDVEVTYKQTDDVVFVNVFVKERWYIWPLPYFKIVGRNFNDWWVEHKRSLQRVNYGIKFMHNNVSGRNDHLNIWLITGYTQQVSLRYENPFMDKSLKHGMTIGLNFNRNREVNYADSLNKQMFLKNPDDFLARTIHFDIGYSYRPAIKTRHHVKLQYNDALVEDAVLERNPAYHPQSRNRIWNVGLQYLIQYYDVDYIPYPTNGFKGDGYVSARFSRDFMTQVSARGTYSNEIFRKSYLQMQMAGMVKIPFDQAFYSLGMFGSNEFFMRGLEPYVIQGVAGGFGRATAIKEILNFKVKNPLKIEGHDRIPFRIMLKAYGDLGYAYLPNPGTSILNNKWLRTWGAGIDVLTIYDVVLKLDYSFNQLGQQGLYIHTAVDF